MMSVIAWFLVKLEPSLTITTKTHFSQHPSKTIKRPFNIGELMVLQSKFGIPLTADIITKGSTAFDVGSLRKLISRKISFGKNGAMKRFKDFEKEYINASRVPPESISHH